MSFFTATPNEEPHQRRQPRREEDHEITHEQTHEPTDETNHETTGIINDEMEESPGAQSNQGKKVRKSRNKTRRSHKKYNNSTKELKIMYTNINGINSKKDSLQTIVTNLTPHIITITETKTNKAPKILGYTWKTQIKPNKAGGVAIGVRDDIKENTEKIDMEKEENMEVAWIKINNRNITTYIGTYYGKQENEYREQVEREYSTLNRQIIQLKEKGNVIITGDFNAKLKVEQDNTTIQHESNNGKIMQKTLKITNTIPVSLLTHGEKWTRVNRNKTSEKSIIDYIICDQNTRKYLKDIEIDGTGSYRPKGKNETDHNTIIAKFEIPLKKSNKKITTWNINEKTNWDKYNELLENMPTPKNYNELESNIKQALNTVAKKITITTNKKYGLDTESKKLKQQKKIYKKRFEHECKTNGQNKEKFYKKYIEINKQLNQQIEQENTKRVQVTTSRLINQGGVKSNYFWKLRKSILKNTMEDYDLITEEGHKVTNPEEAKEIIAQYYEGLYQARKARPEYKEWSEKITERYKTITTHEHNNIEEITKKEIKSAIKKTKRKKAPGPDDIPNEAIKTLNKRNMETVRKIFNKIIKDAEIPNQWQNSNIIRFYKGKGTKGKCSSERGITLSSNVGKIFERIINDRVVKKINMTDAQAGGRKQRATTEHIAIIYNKIEENKKKRKPTYITFLDVTKAYDKAWIKAIMYVMNKEGLDNGIWHLVNKLNNNLTARIITKYGPTREIKINDSIRQGGVLSVIEYALLMDEISKENHKTQNNNNNVNTLLWMDDVAIITDNVEEMKTLLKSTQEIADRYCIAFGPEKSNTMIINKKFAQTKTIDLKLGELTLEQVNKYKYLGCTINDKGDQEDQITNIKGKTEAAYQTILHILHDKTFANIQMQTAWKLIETCIIPIITYGTEAWKNNSKSVNKLNKILDDILKRILNVPLSTPREALYLDTNLLDIATIIDKKKLNMYYKIKRNPNNITKLLLKDTNASIWMQETLNIAQKHKINLKNLITLTPGKAKKYIRKMTHKTFRNDMLQNTTNKSKVNYLIEGYTINEKTNYTNILNREDTSIIFKARTRMMDIKSNYKNKYRDMKCRICKKEEETQEHILERCNYTIDNNLTVKKNLLYARGKTILQEVAKKLKTIENKLKSYNTD